MSSTSAQHLQRVSRPVEKLKKPRPLKIQNQNRHSMIDARLSTLEEIMLLTETVGNNLANGNYDRTLQQNIIQLNGMLKSYGPKLEAVYKDQLDRAFVTFRNGSRDESLDYISRIHLLELIEIRAMQWAVNESNNYYKHKYSHQDIDVVSINALESSMSSPNIFQNTQVLNTLSPLSPPTPLLLAPGELVKPSGKYAAPTKIPGKNYCKDEVVIRNSDSGKVMGIKGRRVHMIEELSETVISFQRVSQGAKERLVQITGPTEDKIIYAKQLMEETIRRNASPVRSDLPDKERLGSSSSLNSSTSDDSLRYRSSKRTALLHSFSTSDANLGEYKYTVTIGDDNIKITGTNLDLVRTAKLVLDEYFFGEQQANEQYSNDYSFEEENVVFEPAGRTPESILRVNSQDSEESEDTYKVQQTKVPSELKKSTSFKSFPPGETKNEAEINETEGGLFDEAPPLSAEEVKLLTESAEYYQRKKNVTRVPSQFSSPQADEEPSLITYSCEELIHFADSPLSHRVPRDWASVVKELPPICKKLPVDNWFDPKSYAKKRPQEADAVIAIQSLSETGSPETE